jgi:pantetheine-phosphate adenylyltransferase
MVIKYSKVATGGTFDEIHLGHIALLSKAFQVGTNVIIGISSDEFAKAKGKVIHSYDERVTNLRRTIHSNFDDARFQIVKLDATYGPVVISEDVAALIVSTERATVGYEINKTRINRGISPLSIIIVDMVRAEDGTPISSSRIRAGQIDAQGKLLRRK